MDRPLVGDFILVTSSGKIYTKPELLEEAKTVRITFEQQEAGEKTVRLGIPPPRVSAPLPRRSLLRHSASLPRQLNCPEVGFWEI